MTNTHANPHDDVSPGGLGMGNNGIDQCHVDSYTLQYLCAQSREREEKWFKHFQGRRRGRGRMRG